MSTRNKKRKSYENSSNSNAGKSSKNRIHMTNGYINKMIYPEDESKLLKEGFVRGRTLKKSEGKNC